MSIVQQLKANVVGSNYEESENDYEINDNTNVTWFLYSGVSHYCTPNIHAMTNSQPFWHR